MTGPARRRAGVLNSRRDAIERVVDDPSIQFDKLLPIEGRSLLTA